MFMIQERNIFRFLWTENDSNKINEKSKIYLISSSKLFADLIF